MSAARRSFSGSAPNGSPLIGRRRFLKKLSAAGLAAGASTFSTIAQEITGQGRFDGYALTRDRMRKCKGPGVQHVSRHGAWGLGLGAWAGVHTLSNQWMPELFKMKPDLMLPPSVQS